MIQEHGYQNKMNTTGDNFKVVHIIEPFWGAGSIYNWGKGIPGIGIAEAVVNQAELYNRVIRIKIGNDPQLYIISPVTVRNIAKKYNSTKVVRNKTKVLVVPRNRLLKFEEDYKRES